MEALFAWLLGRNFGEVLDLLEELRPHEHAAFCQVFCNRLDFLLHCEPDNWEQTARFLDISFIVRQHSSVFETWLHQHNLRAAERVAKAFFLVLQVDIVALASFPGFLHTDAFSQVTTAMVDRETVALALTNTLFCDAGVPMDCGQTPRGMTTTSAVGWLEALQVRLDYLTLVADGDMGGSVLKTPKARVAMAAGHHVWTRHTALLPGTLIRFVEGDRSELVDAALDRILGFLPAKQLQAEVASVHAPEVMDRLLAAINRLLAVSPSARQLFISPPRVRLLHGMRQQLSLLFCLCRHEGSKAAPRATPPSDWPSSSNGDTSL